MRKLKVRFPFPPFTWAIVLCVGLVGCQKMAPENPASARSKDHLRVALSALDRGDDAKAESELQLSLSADPFNGRARTTLASLYAKQSGLSLKDWLDPFWEAGRQLSSRLKNFQQSSEILDEVSKDLKTLSTQAQDGLTEDEKKARARIADLANDSAKFFMGASVALDVFRAIPSLSDDRLKTLDKAIDTLREEGLAPADRPEEQRVYLSVLSFVRLVNHLKRLLGDQGSTSFSAQKARLCSLNSDALKVHLDEVRISLARLEEGLVVSPQDPQTSQRAARRRLQQFVTKFLISSAWEQTDSLFDESTAEGKAAVHVSKRLCEKLKTPDLPTSDSLTPALESLEEEANSP